MAYFPPKMPCREQRRPAEHCSSANGNSDDGQLLDAFIGPTPLLLLDKKIRGMVDSGDQRARVFTTEICAALKETVCAPIEEWDCAVQAARMVLRETLVVSETYVPEPDRSLIFVQLGFYAIGKGSSMKEECTALLQELLEVFSDEERGQLLRTPKVRKLLLISFPMLGAVFEEIEKNDTDFFLYRRQELGEIFDFKDNWAVDGAVEITPKNPDGKIDAATIDALFDLAEVALRCAGRAQWATGVLSFLAALPGGLNDDHLRRALRLRTQLLQAIEYDPLAEVTVLLDGVVAKTAIMIQELRMKK
jgi:hypothetical protein